MTGLGHSRSTCDLAATSCLEEAFPESAAAVAKKEFSNESILSGVPTLYIATAFEARILRIEASSNA